jgi:hypothetical protein
MNLIPVNLPSEERQKMFDYLKISENYYHEDLRSGITTNSVTCFYDFRASRSNTIGILNYYLGFTEKAALFGREAIMASHEQLYGDWQKVVPSGNYHDEPPSVAYWRKYQLWETCVSAGLLWSSALHEWHAVRIFAEYLQDDARLDPSQSKQERAWYIILSGACRGRDWKK